MYVFEENTASSCEERTEHKVNNSTLISSIISFLNMYIYKRHFFLLIVELYTFNNCMFLKSKWKRNLPFPCFQEFENATCFAEHCNCWRWLLCLLGFPSLWIQLLRVGREQRFPPKRTSNRESKNGDVPAVTSWTSGTPCTWYLAPRPVARKCSVW